MYLRASDFTSHGKAMVWDSLIERGHEYDEDIEVVVSDEASAIVVEKDDLVDPSLWETLSGTMRNVGIKRVGIA